MPPEENKNKNIPLDTFKIGAVDPVFKSTPDRQKNPSQVIPTSAFNVLNNQQYTPAKPATPTMPVNIPPTSANPKSIVRTYKGDLESAISANHLSSINIAIAENQKMHSQIQPEQAEMAAPSEYSKNKIIIFVSLILVVLGAAGVGITFMIKGQNSAPAIKTQEVPSLITAEFKDELNTGTVAPSKIVNTLSSKLNNSQITVNNFDNVYLTAGTSTGKRLIDSGEFVTLMNFKMPDIIKRSLQPAYMVGTYSFGKNLPFIILKATSFESSYAGMLDWEKNMAQDFQIIFHLPGYENSGNALAGLVPTAVKNFEDSVIVNKDVRLLRDAAGQIIFLYGIIDKETIVITVSDTAFKEIINRLNKQNSLQR